MGLLTWIVERLVGAEAAPAAAVHKVAGDGQFRCEVAGESKYQRTLERLAGGRDDESAWVTCTANLVLEPTNPYDGNAVRVDVDGRTVGYLPRGTAVRYHEYLAAAGLGKPTLSVAAVIVGGWDRDDGDRGSFGIKLDLPLAKLLRAAKKAAASPGKR